MEYYLPTNYTKYLNIWWPMKRSTVFVAVTVCSALTGCASKHVTPDPIQLPPNTAVLQEIRDISVEARHELRLLAKAQESMAQKSQSKEQHEQRFFQAVHVPAGFEQRVSFSYSGEARKAAEAMAAIAGYQFEVVGNPHPRDPYVSIFINGQPLNNALKELGMQTGDGIRVEVHETAKLMQFKYKNYRIDRNDAE